MIANSDPALDLACLGPELLPTRGEVAHDSSHPTVKKLETLPPWVEPRS